MTETLVHDPEEAPAKGVWVQSLLKPEMAEKLKRYAEECEISQSAVIRTAVKRLLKEFGE